MVHVMVRHQVSDYNHWKEVFDAHLTARRHAGEADFRLFQNVDNPREIVLLSDWTSLEEARRFMTSDDLKQAMQRAGVVGSPDVQYLEDARTVRRTAAD